MLTNISKVTEHFKHLKEKFIFALHVLNKSLMYVHKVSGLDSLSDLFTEIVIKQLQCVRLGMGKSQYYKRIPK